MAGSYRTGMMRRSRVGAALLISLAGGCSASLSNAALKPATSAYSLTSAEREMGCEKLTGRMQLRILDMRSSGSGEVGTPLSRSIHSVLSSADLTTGYGTDTARRRQRDHAMLAAYNKRLADKGCPTFDLAGALSSGDQDLLPSPARTKNRQAGIVAPTLPAPVQSFGPGQSTDVRPSNQ